MMEREFPHAIRNVTEGEDAIIKQYYTDYIRPFVRVGAEGYLMMAGYADHAADIHNLEVRPDDVWVTSFARSGTTWLQELVWLVANELDFDAAKERAVTNRFAYIEYPTQASEVSKPPSGLRSATEDDFRTLAAVPSPRFVKSHLPLSLLPPGLLDTAKVLYIAREPRDAIVSFHFAHKLFRYFDDRVAIQHFWDLFKNDLIMHTPLFPHVKESWDRRDHPNLMFLFYEDLKKDLPGAIDKVCAFLGKKYSAEQKQKLAEYLNFENMKQRDVCLPGRIQSDNDGQNEKTFFRKGQAGGWVSYFDDHMKEEADEYIDKNLARTDMRYPVVD